MKKLIISLACGVSFAVCCAQATEIEVPELITDRTISPAGHMFYRSFCDSWQGSYAGNMSISERPSARWGSWITITADNNVLTRFSLNPTQRDLEKTVASVIMNVDQSLAQQKINQAALSTQDLTSDEL